MANSLKLLLFQLVLIFGSSSDVVTGSTVTMETRKLSTLLLTTTESTTKSTTTLSSDCYPFYNGSSCSRYFFWYDIVGPLFGIIFVVAIMISCCKCLAVAIKKRYNTWRGRDGSVNRVGVGENDDLPPSYDAVGVGSIDLENIVTIDGSIRRKDVSKIEDKLPTYQEISEILSQQKDDSISLDNKTDQLSTQTYQVPTEESIEQSNNRHESLSRVPSVFNDNNAFEIEEDDERPPPPYQPSSEVQ